MLASGVLQSFIDRYIYKVLYINISYIFIYLYLYINKYIKFIYHILLYIIYIKLVSTSEANHMYIHVYILNIY